MRTLNILCWDGYDHRSFGDGFWQATGIRIRAEPLVSDQSAVDRVNDPKCAVDILNINNPYPREQLHPAGAIVELDRRNLSSNPDDQFPWLDSLAAWQLSESGALIGLCQRFGSFNLVANTRKISAAAATDLGFRIVEETAPARPYGILLFPEFNIFHICIAANLNPFIPLDVGQLDVFEKTARLWFDNASIVTDDSNILNRALVSGGIDYFLSGGVFTSGAVRHEGHTHIACITPSTGPIGGKGAISFMEITSVTRHCRRLGDAYEYLNHITRPAVAAQIATNSAVCNPVAQMKDPAVMQNLSRRFLQAIQWETIEEDIGRCASYRLPPSYPDLFFRLELARKSTAR